MQWQWKCRDERRAPSALPQYQKTEGDDKGGWAEGRKALGDGVGMQGCDPLSRESDESLWSRDSNIGGDSW
jgi:hypothetical protein